MSNTFERILSFFFIFSDYGFPIFGKQSKEILEDVNSSRQLLEAIDKDKHGQPSLPIRHKNKSYRLVRAGENSLVS